MERELKKVKLNTIMADGETRARVDAHTTAVAGLVVAPLRELEVRGATQRIITRKNNWVIWLYPIGMRVLGEFPTKAQAIEFANTRLAKYSFVGLFVEDVRKANDMHAMQTDFVGYRQEIADMRAAAGLS